ncbi:MAG: hypothetical protein ACXW15_13475, partial [Acidimicrobiia bacterium]
AGSDAFHTAQAGVMPGSEFIDAPVAVIPVAAGRALVELFSSLGAQQVVTGGQTMNPSTQDLLAAVNKVKADTVILLPNNKNIIPVANQIDGLTDKTVLVVPTATVPQGLAAMVAYFPTNPDGQKTRQAMTEYAQDVRTGELTRAIRSSSTSMGTIVEGDWLGLADGELCSVDHDQKSALIELVERLVDGESELVTIITGLSAPIPVTNAVREWLAIHHPDMRIEVVKGEQPLYPYLISVE